MLKKVTSYYYSKFWWHRGTFGMKTIKYRTFSPLIETKNGAFKSFFPINNYLPVNSNKNFRHMHCFTPRNNCFIAPNNCLKAQNNGFTMRNNCFTMRNNCFPPRNNGFKAPNNCNKVRNNCLATRKKCSAAYFNSFPTANN